LGKTERIKEIKLEAKGDTIFDFLKRTRNTKGEPPLCQILKEKYRNPKEIKDAPIG
jgi:hypothetical protein